MEPDFVCMFCLLEREEPGRPFFPKDPAQHNKNCSGGACIGCTADFAIRHYIDRYRNGEIKKRLCQGPGKAEAIIKRFLKTDISCLNCFSSFRVTERYLKEKGAWDPLVEKVRKTLVSWSEDAGVKKLCDLAEELSEELQDVKIQHKALEQTLEGNKKKLTEETKKRKRAESNLRETRVELQLRERQLKIQSQIFMNKMARRY